MWIDIHLGRDAEYTLTYELFNNRVAEVIWNNYKDNNYEFVSRTQFYNWGETIAEVQANLNHSIDNIQRIKPEIFTGSDDLNRLHENFPDHVHAETGELREWLSMFNYHLHHLEDITGNKNRRFLISTATGEPAPQPLEDSDYELFSPTRLDNHLYMNYPHVGKHIMEICYDNDVDVPQEHIIPTSIVKSDLLAWFAPDQCVDAKAVTKHVKRWCMQVAHKLPHAIDDPKLAIGHIALGKLTQKPDLEKISRYKFVHSISSR